MKTLSPLNNLLVFIKWQDLLKIYKIVTFYVKVNPVNSCFKQN